MMEDACERKLAIDTLIEKYKEAFSTNENEIGKLRAKLNHYSTDDLVRAADAAIRFGLQNLIDEIHN